MKIMKKNMIHKMMTAVMLLAVVVLVSACNSNADNALWWSDIYSISGPGVTTHAVTLEIGQTLQLSATPDTKGLDWFSNNEKVATVSEDGLVTAIALGQAYITVYPKEFESSANGNYIVVTVVDKSVGFVDDSIDQSEAE